MKRGQALIEYAAMLALVLIIAMPAVSGTGRSVNNALMPLVDALGGATSETETPARGPTPIVFTATPQPTPTKLPPRGTPIPPRIDPPITPTPIDQ